MNDLFRSDFKEPRRLSSWLSVLLAIGILVCAGYVAHKGLEYFAADLSRYINHWEEKYDGVKDGFTWNQKTPSGSGMKVILSAPK